MTTTQTKNFSDQDLYDVNDNIARTLIPAMVYVGVMMVFGVLGNVLVCVVFITNMKRGTQNFLITSLAVFDLLSSLLAMPVEIADMRFYYTFRSEFACRLERFVNAFFSIASIVTLMAIAVDRYIKVCRPLRTHMQIREAKISVGVAVVLGVVFSWPAPLIYGIRTVDTKVPGIVGKNCDSIKHTLYPRLYHAILAVAFLGLAVALAVLYTLIGIEVRRHRRYMRKTSTIAMPASSSHQTSVTSSAEMTSSVADLPHVETGITESCGDSTKSEKPRIGYKLRDKTTVIGFTVTLVFVGSFLPFLCLMGTSAFVTNFDYHLNDGALVAYNIFLRSYFVNSAANPFIYGVLNIRFREQCLKVIKRVFCCVTFRSPNSEQSSSQ